MRNLYDDEIMDFGSYLIPVLDIDDIEDSTVTKKTFVIG